MNLRNKTTLEFRTVFGSPLGDPNSQVSLYMYSHMYFHIYDIPLGFFLSSFVNKGPLYWCSLSENITTVTVHLISTFNRLHETTLYTIVDK